MMLKRSGDDTISVPRCTLSENHEYFHPKRMVFSEDQMKQWENSEAYQEYLGFINAMNKAVKGKSLKQDCYVSEVTQGLLTLVQTLDQLITDTPLINQPQRFGNKAFRNWYEEVKKNANEYLKTALPTKFHNSIVELVDYFTESFGNSIRIDYGTGHEMSFCMFLYCLFKIGAFTERDAVAVINKIFNSYLELVRRLQMTYRMEPAGSHGVWSLDDYQFVPFIWGSAQFINRPIIEPKMFVQDDVIQRYHEDYIFISCIKYITTVKTGHFAEHSNQLWNISALNSWSKINDGLLKMYKGEVLAKFPVIQHVLFGSLLRFIPFSLKTINTADNCSKPAEQESEFAKPMDRRPT